MADEMLIPSVGEGEVSHLVRDSAVGHDAELVVIGGGRATHPHAPAQLHVFDYRDFLCPVISVWLYLK